MIENKTLLYESMVPVAERIPDALLDDLRRDPKGSLRIKLKLHREGVLVGWDLERRLGYDPKKTRDAKGISNYVAPAYSHTGGDFKEARIAYYLWEGDNLQGLPADILIWQEGMGWPRTLFRRWPGYVTLPPSMAYPPSAQEQQLLDKNNLYLVPGTIMTNPPTPSNHRRIMEKGWYIHPRTKERMELDY